MTKEQWETAEQNLQSSYRIVKLQADGYTLSLQTQRYKMQLCIAVYVDGKIQGKWLTEDCEIRRKFFQKHKHSILNRKAETGTESLSGGGTFQQRLLHLFSLLEFFPFFETASMPELHRHRVV